ncbi:MAG: N-acetylmuramoyl-L-alanine amidase [bacterium]
MKKTIILDAGHSLTDPGAVSGGTTESKEAIKIRDLLIPLLKQSFDVLAVPDNLDLVQSIKWVNTKCPNLEDGLALAIHLNAGGGTGAETYFYAGQEKSRVIAQTIIDTYCGLTSFRSRGAKSDATTSYGRLGWIRDVSAWSCLIELSFIDTPADLTKLQTEHDEIAFAIYSSLCAVYGIKPVTIPVIVTPPVNTQTQIIKEQIKVKLNELNALVNQL